MTESYFQENSHRLLWVDTDNRHIISMKSRGFSQTPQDIIEEYIGCSVPQYTRYPLIWLMASNPDTEHKQPLQSVAVHPFYPEAK